MPSKSAFHLTQFQRQHQLDVYGIHHQGLGWCFSLQRTCSELPQALLPRVTDCEKKNQSLPLAAYRCVSGDVIVILPQCCFLAYRAMMKGVRVNKHERKNLQRIRAQSRICQP